MMMCAASAGKFQLSSSGAANQGLFRNIKHADNVAACTPCPRTAHDGCAPDVKYPGDDSPVVWGACGHAFHLQVRVQSDMLQDAWQILSAGLIWALACLFDYLHPF